MRSHRLAISLFFVAAALLAPSCIHGEEEEKEEKLILPNCKDNNELCQEWASSGECEANSKYMLKTCKRSCNNCLGERDENPLVVLPDVRYKGNDLGTPQQLTFPDGTREQDIYWILNKARNYMRNVVEETVGDDVLEICKNQHEHCAYWALIGECTENPKCESCLLSFENVVLGIGNRDVYTREAVNENF
jgi:hypothetical protein